MNCSTYSSRNRYSRRKEYRYQGNSQGIILHTDFQRNGMLLFFAQTQFSCNKVTNEESTKIVQQNHDNNESA